MNDSTDKVIQFLVCAQNDFIGRIRPDEIPPNELHVGHEASIKLRGQGGRSDPFVEAGARFFNDSISGADKIHIILAEHWHSVDDYDEFNIWGRHSVEGTDGVKLPEELEQYRSHPRCHSIRANSINISTDPRYKTTIEEAIGNTKPNLIRAGIIGVYTEINVEYLIIALNTVYPGLSFDSIGVCEPLCASNRKEDHDNAIGKFRNFGVQVFCDREEYCREWLGLDY